MKVISNKDADLFSQFDKINENLLRFFERPAFLPPQIRGSPHQKKLINKHADANKGKIKRCLFLEDIFGFCTTFKR